MPALRAKGLTQRAPDLYVEPGHRFGGVPLVVLSGDFMQLPPFEGRVRCSLVKPSHEHAPIEHLNGMKLFRDGVTDVVILPKTYRFVDRIVVPPRPCTVLPRLFEFMRDPESAGGHMPNDLWRALQACEVKLNDDQRVRALYSGALPVYELAIAWEAVARLLQYRARRDAWSARQLVLYVQAIDRPVKAVLSDSEHRRALQVLNMTTTGNRLGMLPLFCGQRVRLTAKLSAKHQLVQDAVGVVLGVDLDDREFEASGPQGDWRTNRSHVAHTDGFVGLRYMPVGVHVKFDGYDEDVGLGIGVVYLRPLASRWTFSSHFVDDGGVRRMREVPMVRLQFPLAPEHVRTVQTAQGMSVDKCVMYLSKPGNMNDDDWWFHVYVMLSRVRCVSHLLAFGLPPDGSSSVALRSGCGMHIQILSSGRRLRPSRSQGCGHPWDSRPGQPQPRCLLSCR